MAKKKATAASHQRAAIALIRERNKAQLAILQSHRETLLANITLTGAEIVTSASDDTFDDFLPSGDSDGEELDTWFTEAGQ